MEPRSRRSAMCWSKNVSTISSGARSLGLFRSGLDQLRVGLSILRLLRQSRYPYGWKKTASSLQVVTRAVIVSESHGVFNLLCAARNTLMNEGLLLATGLGIPRSAFRRMMHRLSKAYDIPVLVLNDNDTWGYFGYAVLEQGLLEPNASFPFLSVERLGYIGVRAGEYTSREFRQRKWKPIWTERISHLRTYRCFQSVEWQREFDAFEAGQFAIDVDTLVELLGVDRALQELVISKSASREYLT